MKIQILALTFVSLLSATSFAASHPTGLDLFPEFSGEFSKLLEPGFYPPAALPPKNVPQQLMRAAQASVRIQMRMGSCSASIVSEDGYVLTAVHCIDRCLDHNGYVKISRSFSPEYSIHESTNQKPENLHCNVNLVEHGLYNPKVVFIGRGFAEFDDREIMNIPEQDLEKMVRIEDDFAILKYETHSKLPCIPVSLEEVKTGEPVWAIGFPGRTSRPDGWESNGSNQYASYGSIYSDITSNQYYREQNFGPEMIARLQKFYGVSWQFVSNMDIYSGNSGSMAINSRGELVGVNVAGAVPDGSIVRDRYVDGTAISTRFTSLYEETRAALGQEEVSRIFSCGR